MIICKPFKKQELFAKIQEHLTIEYIDREYSIDVFERSPADSPQLTAESLQTMPVEWLQEFKQAAAELDETKLEGLIQQIPPERNYLVRPLSDLLNNFQFEKMYELAELST